MRFRQIVPGLLVLIALVVPCLSTPADAGLGLSARWDRDFDNGSDEFGNAVAMDGDVAFTVGTSGVPGSVGDPTCLADEIFAGCRMVVRADSAKDGTNLWIRQLPGVGSAVAAVRNLVFVGGSGTDASGGRDFRVVALDRRTGNVVWQNGFRPAGVLAGQVFRIAVDGDQVFAVGHLVLAPFFGATEFIVRAYDARTGATLWDDRSPAGPFLDRLFGVAVQGGHVVASGGRRFNFLVRTYDRKTGALAWQDTANSFIGFDEAKNVAIHGDRVFVVGELASSRGASRDFFVRAYDLETGAVRWSSLLETGGFDFLTEAAAGGDKVFVAGIGGPACGFFSPGDCQWLVRAHDAATGAVVWESWFNTESDHDQPISVTVRGARVFVSGQGGQQCPVACDFIVRAYDARTGTVLVSERFDRHGGDDTYPFLAVHGEQLAIVGSSQSVLGDYDIFTRVYDLHD